MATPAFAPVHGSKAEIFMNGYAISIYMSSATTSRQKDKADASTFRSTAKRYTLGLADTTLTTEGYYDSNKGRIDDIMQTAINTDAENLITHFPGGASLGKLGKSVWAVQTKYEVSSPIGSTVSVSCEASAGPSGIVDYVRALVFETTVAANGNSASYDYGTVSTNPGALVLHAYTTGDDLVITLQDSADNATFADVASVTLSGGTVLDPAYHGIRGLTTNPLRRYARVTWTGTSGHIFLAAVGRR